MLLALAPVLSAIRTKQLHIIVVLTLSIICIPVIHYVAREGSIRGAKGGSCPSNQEAKNKHRYSCLRISGVGMRKPRYKTIND